ncbi:MAG TPA: hypothetical protein VIL46_12635 [Gemmataceae bacterium]
MTVRSSPSFPHAAVVLRALGGLAMSDRPAFSGPPEGRYVFVRDTDRWVGVILGEWRFIGKLDKNGDLLPQIKLKASGAYSAGIPLHTRLNRLRPAPAKAYEFRSGVLVPGELQKDGRFVPEAGGTIIPFEDYEYREGATPIWNLPGVFLTEEVAARMKRSKAADKK